MNFFKVNRAKVYTPFERLHLRGATSPASPGRQSSACAPLLTIPFPCHPYSSASNQPHSTKQNICAIINRYERAIFIPYPSFITSNAPGEIHRIRDYHHVLRPPPKPPAAHRNKSPDPNDQDQTISGQPASPTPPTLANARPWMYRSH